MFVITPNSLWAVSFLFFIFYITFIFSLILYNLPLARSLTSTLFKKTTSIKFLEGSDYHFFLLSYVLLVFLLNVTWVSYPITSWFGNLIFSNFQHKFFFLILFILYLTILFFNSAFIFGSYEVNDFYITCFNFFIWISFLFSANTLFCAIFFIEILSTLILLLITTSTFSTTYFYSNTNYSLNSYQTTLSATVYLNSLLFFFWISLLGSLGLFFFLSFFYTQFFSFDWNIAEFSLNYVLCSSSYLTLISLFFSWVFLFICVFIKCGLVPFYFWKPTFFKGLPLPALFFYIFFFYFFIFLFFIFLFFFYLNEMFYVFAVLFNILLATGFLTLFTILCDSFYIKIFLALSSILNTLFIFLVFAGITPDFFFFGL